MRRAVGVAAAGLWSKSASAAGSAAGALTFAAILPVVEAIVPAMLGMLGAAVVHAYFPPRSLLIALSNGAISVVLGGVAGPAAVEVAAFYWSTPSSVPVVWTVSFVLAAAWPWLAPTLWDGLKSAWAGIVSRIAGDSAKKGAKSGRR